MTTKRLFDFTDFPDLTTERLTLRKPLPSDAADILVFRGDPEVQRYNSPTARNVQEIETQIEEDIYGEFNREEGITWAATLIEGGPVIGLFSLRDWSYNHRRAEADYDLARQYWGQGIATEALRAILHFGYEQMNLHRIYAFTIADNQESVLLLEKVGFQREGTQRESSWEDDGTFHDSAIYGLLRREFFR